MLSARDVCQDTGLARLSYGQARTLLDQHTALAGPGTGWDLPEYRHSGLTHLGEQGASELMLMARSRRKKAENVRRYVKPSPEAIAEVTSLLAPGHRCGERQDQCAGSGKVGEEHEMSADGPEPAMRGGYPGTRDLRRGLTEGCRFLARRGPYRGQHGRLPGRVGNRRRAGPARPCCGGSCSRA